MANILTDLTVEKVAFVDEGDNPQANILLFKRRPEEAHLPVEDTGGDEGILKRLAVAAAKILGMADDKTDIQGNNSESGNIPDNAINKVDKCDKDKPCTEKKGDFTDMSRIDKSKLTPEELAQLEAIEKKALIDEPDRGAPEPEMIIKEAATILKEPDLVNKGAEKTEDIYKGIHPAVREELEALKKFRSDAEEKELLGVAKKYEIIGKKPEELVRTFKSLKAAGGTAFDEMIAVLDEAVNIVNKSGVFGEIGMNTSGSAGVTDKIGIAAAEVRKNADSVTNSAAIVKAWEDNPELAAEYEREYAGGVR